MKKIILITALLIVLIELLVSKYTVYEKLTITTVMGGGISMILAAYVPVLICVSLLILFGLLVYTSMVSAILNFRRITSMKRFSQTIGAVYNAK